jgi:hypothetical protein
LEFGHRKTCRRQTEVPREFFTVYRGVDIPWNFGDAAMDQNGRLFLQDGLIA